MATLSNVIRQLSAVCIINSEVFSRLSAAQKTETLSSATTPVVFVDNFVKLSNKKNMLDKLLAGEDAALELEFNGVVLTDEEKAILGRSAAIVQKIGANLQKLYPWRNPNPTSTAEHNGFRVNRTTIVNISNYNEHSIGVRTAKKIWDVASKHWASGSGGTTTMEPITASGFSRYPEITPSNVKIGCQTISRERVEWLAHHFGWEPNVAD